MLLSEKMLKDCEHVKGRTIEELSVGDTAYLTREITSGDILLFAIATGDKQPIHLDESYAKTTFFGKRIAHGMLTGGFISAVLGMKLPGPGTIYLSQSLDFKKPVFIGDIITATVTVEKIGKKSVGFLTTCCNQNGEEVLAGHAVVMPPKK